MKTAWFILLVSAFTDGLLAAATALGAVLTTQPTTWTWTMILVPVVGGVAVAARSVQQALKATPANSAALIGQPAVTVTQTPDAIVKVTPVETVVVAPKPKRQKP